MWYFGTLCKKSIRKEILAYAKKMGYISDKMQPVQMTCGTKSLVANTEFLLMWFKILARDVRRNCDQKCTQLVCDPHEFLPCNYYDWKYNKCILEMLLDEQ